MPATSRNAGPCPPPDVLGRHHQDGVVAGHRADHALEAAAVEGGTDHVADPGGVRSTTRLAECATSTTHSPSTRRKWSSGAIWCTGNSGRA